MSVSFRRSLPMIETVCMIGLDCMIGLECVISGRRRGGQAEGGREHLGEVHRTPAAVAPLQLAALLDLCPAAEPVRDHQGALGGPRTAGSSPSSAHCMETS